jgi:predicted dehydrogenase
VTLRLGLLSTARINREILAAAAAVDRVEVVAVGSRDAARAATYAREHGIPIAHGSYEALVGDPDVDAVYVSLPNGLHHEWTMRALAAGKHVLCEKPYSRRPEDVAEAFDEAERSALVLMEAFMYRHHPQTHRVKALVDEGAIGRLRHVRAVFDHPLLDPADFRHRPELNGGALMDLGCYCVNGARLLAGMPRRVEGRQKLGPTGTDASFDGTMWLDDDVVARFECSFVHPRRQRLEVVGEEGTLVVEAPWRVDWGGEVLVRRGNEVRQADVDPGNSYRLELENFADAARGRAPALLGRDDALGQARVIDALFLAAETGVSAEVPPVP